MGTDKKSPPRWIGYLRTIPSATSEQRSLAGPQKAMANKLIFEGLVDRSLGALYKRTTKGDEAVRTFDEALDDAEVELLARVGAGERVPGDAPGVRKLVAADLLRISMSTGSPVLPAAGEALVESRKGKPPVP